MTDRLSLAHRAEPRLHTIYIRRNSPQQRPPIDTSLFGKTSATRDGAATCNDGDMKQVRRSNGLVCTGEPTRHAPSTSLNSCQVHRLARLNHRDRSLTARLCRTRNLGKPSIHPRGLRDDKRLYENEWWTRRHVARTPSILVGLCRGLSRCPAVLAYGLGKPPTDAVHRELTQRSLWFASSRLKPPSSRKGTGRLVDKPAVAMDGERVGPLDRDVTNARD